MAVTIYHNPRCSKSRKTLQLVIDSGIPYTVVKYLEEVPDSAAVMTLARQLGIRVQALLRRGEDTFRSATDLPDLDDDEALAAWLARHPIVLERPIVVSDSGKAIIGRPPENVLEILSS